MLQLPVGWKIRRRILQSTCTLEDSIAKKRIFENCLVAKDALMKHLQGKTPEMVQQHLSMLRLDLAVAQWFRTFI